MSMADETKVEETTPSPSEEIKPVEEKVVPYDRFKEVIEEKNRYKELLQVQSERLQTPEQPVQENYEEALKIVDTRIEDKVSKKLDAITRQADLDRTIAQNPDFYRYSELIKQKVQENPYVSWSDAYKLAKYDADLLAAREAGKKEAYQKIEEKKQAMVESAEKAKPAKVETTGEINPLAKGPDGKYLYSLKELEDILPKKQS